MEDKLLITPHPLDVPSLQASVENPKAGAVATFLGVTRNFNGNREVEYLHYEAYESMAMKLMAKVRDEAMRKHPFLAMVLAHRTGKVAVKEPSVFIAVSACHRNEAFGACRHAIDRLKSIVPIWKREIFTNNKSEWIANGESIGTKI